MNQILAALEAAEREALLAQAQVRRFEAGAVLHELGGRLERVYFPIDAVVAYTVGQPDGAPVETGTVGREGVVCAAAVAGDGTAFEAAVVQGPGDITVAPLAVVNQLRDRSPRFRALLGAYVQAYLAQVSQSVLCNALHSSEARLARWLLMCADRKGDTRLTLDRRQMADMLGIGRPSVTVVMGTLRTAGLIRVEPDVITVVDREGLEEAACDCYARIRQVFARLEPFR